MLSRLPRVTQVRRRGPGDRLAPRRPLRAEPQSPTFPRSPRSSHSLGPCVEQQRTRTGGPQRKPSSQAVEDGPRTAAFAIPKTHPWIQAARRRRGRGGGGGCRRARAAGRRQARGDERRAPGEGAAPGDRLQPRRAPRPRPAPPGLPRAEAAARAGAALIALGPGTQPARSRDNLAPAGMTIRPNGTTSLPEE